MNKPHFSAARRAGDFVFVSGQLPFDNDMQIVSGDIVVQTQVVLNNIAVALATADCGLEDVVKTMVWLKDPDDFPGFNATYAEFFPNHPPARATVGSQLMVEGALIEIEAVAHKPGQAVGSV